MNHLLRQAEEIRSKAQKSYRRLEGAREQLTKKAESAWKDTMDLVKQNPANALGIALGTGFALGSLTVVLAMRRDESAAERLRGITNTGVDAWKRIAGGLNDAIGEFKEAVGDAVAKFK